MNYLRLLFLIPASTYDMHFSRQHLSTLTKILFMLLLKNVCSFYIPQSQIRIFVSDTEYLSQSLEAFGRKQTNKKTPKYFG